MPDKPPTSRWGCPGGSRLHGLEFRAGVRTGVRSCVTALAGRGRSQGLGELARRHVLEKKRKDKGKRTRGSGQIPGESPSERVRGRQRRNPEGRPVERGTSESHSYCQVGQRSSCIRH